MAVAASAGDTRVGSLPAAAQQGPRTLRLLFH